jgi:uncharacterized protein (TIGR00369 family)
MSPPGRTLVSMPSERVRGFVETMGIAETPLAPGVVRCDLAVTDAHRNIQGVIHGSVVFSLLDTAMGHALSGLLAEGEFCSTTQLSLQFLQASRPGDRLSAVGRVTRKGNRIAYLEGTCVNAKQEEVARAHGTWYVGRLKPESATR